MIAGEKKQAGFTIAEMAIVIAIGGIILAIMGSKFLAYIEENKIASTEYRISVIQDAIRQHLQELGRYPCTASLTTPPGAATYNRSIAADCAGVAGAAAAGTILRPGARVLTVDSIARNYAIRIGGVPVRSLNLPDEFALDAWGNRFSYVVSTNLATPFDSLAAMGYAPDRGVINITGFDDGVNPPVSLVNPPGSAHYLIISHGPDGAGARSFEGIGFSSPCNVDAGNNPIDQDAHNCDFTPAGVSPQFVKTLVDNTAPNTINFFHDYVVFEEEVRQARFEFPSGAVVSFNRTSCPDKWSLFPQGFGRFIMGRGPDDNPATPIDPSIPATDESNVFVDQYDMGTVTTTVNQTYNVIGNTDHNPRLIVPYHTTQLYCIKN